MKPPQYSQDWNDELRALYRHDMREMWDRSIAPHIFNHYHDQLDRYLRIAGTAPLDILDVGCAQGTLALLLAERGHRVTAVDLRAEFLEYAKSRYTHGAIRFVQANALSEDLPGTYDLVFANQLVEHMVYPVEFLSRLRRAMRPGSRLVVTTPNGDYVRNALPSFSSLGDPSQWEHRQFTADGDGHFFAYRALELQSIVESGGYEGVEVSFFESPMISGHMKIRHLHRFTPRAVLRTLDRAVLAMPWAARMLGHQLMACGTVPRAAGG